LETFLQQLINGLSLGAIYALIALGYTMVYGVLRLINFAHGDVYMLGAFAGYFIANALKLDASPSILWAIFVTIGAMAFIGGCSRVNQDIPPFVKAVGNPVELYGLNTVGLRRASYPTETVSALKRAYRLFFNSDLNLSQAQERARQELPSLPEVDLLLEFVASSSRGIPA